MDVGMETEKENVPMHRPLQEGSSVTYSLKQFTVQQKPQHAKNNSSSPFLCTDVSIISARSPNDSLVSGILLQKKLDAELADYQEAEQTKRDSIFGSAERHCDVDNSEEDSAQDSSESTPSTPQARHNDFELLEQLHIAKSQLHTLQEKLNRRERRAARADSPDRSQGRASGTESDSTDDARATRKRVHSRMRNLMDAYPAQLQEVVGSPSTWSRRASMADSPAPRARAGKVAEELEAAAEEESSSPMEEATSPNTSGAALDVISESGDSANNEATQSGLDLACFCQAPRTHLQHIPNYDTFSFRISAPPCPGAAGAAGERRCCVSFCTANGLDVAFSMSFVRDGEQQQRRRRRGQQLQGIASENKATVLSKTTELVGKVGSAIGAGLLGAWKAVQKQLAPRPVPRVLASYVRQQAHTVTGSSQSSDPEHRRLAMQQHRARLVAQVCAMGFDPGQARLALSQADYCIEDAISLLVACGVQPSTGSSASQLHRAGIAAADTDNDLLDDSLDIEDDLDAQLRELEQRKASKSTSDSSGDESTLPLSSQHSSQGASSFRDIVPLTRLTAGTQVHTFETVVPAAGGEFELVFFNCENRNQFVQLCFQAEIVSNACEAERFFDACLGDRRSGIQEERNEESLLREQLDDSAGMSSLSIRQALRVRLPEDQKNVLPGGISPQTRSPQSFAAVDCLAVLDDPLALVVHCEVPGSSTANKDSAAATHVVASQPAYLDASPVAVLRPSHGARVQRPVPRIASRIARMRDEGVQRQQQRFRPAALESASAVLSQTFGQV